MSGANRTDKLSKQEINNISQKAGANPFEAVQQIFNEVPLVNIDSQDINIKIPALTSDDIKKYQNYLGLWIEKNNQIVQDRGDFLLSIASMCDAKELKDQISNSKAITKQITDLESIKAK